MAPCALGSQICLRVSNREKERDKMALGPHLLRGSSIATSSSSTSTPTPTNTIHTSHYPETVVIAWTEAQCYKPTDARRLRGLTDDVT